MLECTEAPAADWLPFARARGEFYHDPRWAETLAAAFGYRLHCLSHREDGALTGILALAEVPGLIGPRRLVSLPFSYAAGPLGTAPAAVDALMAFAVERARQVGVGRVEIKRVVEDVAAPPSLAYIRRSHYATYRLDTGGGEAAVMQRLHPESTRRGIRKAEREGVLVRRGTELLDWTAMAMLEEETARSHGVPAPPRRFFTEGCRALQAAGLADLLLADGREGRGLLAGVVIWKGPRRWIYAFGASRPESLPVRPNHALLWAAIRQAIAAGVGFDFGRAAPEQGGLVEFKRRWGGVAVPLAHDYWPEAGGLNTGDRSKGPLAWAARIWSLLPRPVTLAGSALYRFLG